MLETVRKILAFLFHLIARPEIQGAENIPAQGACIIATNHLSILDAPLIFTAVTRKDFTALIARKHKKNPFIRWLVSQVDGVWIDRYMVELEPLRQITRHLKEGGIIGISPEGTRSQTNQLIKAKTGVAYLAAKTNALIVPVAVTGTENAVADWKRLRRPTLTLRFGAAFQLPALDSKNRDTILEENTDEIMCRIAAMLPERYRGVYSRHPRLKVLLVENNVL